MTSTQPRALPHSGRDGNKIVGIACDRKNIFTLSPRKLQDAAVEACFSYMIAYLSLFSAAFIAATLLPAQSELALAGLLTLGEQPAWALVVVATAGNVLGSGTNWLIGRYFMRFKDRRWFPATGERLDKAQAWYRKYGRWSLLLSWAPVIGDPLTLIAGVLREPFASFCCIVLIAKLGRYLVVAGIALQWAA